MIYVEGGVVRGGGEEWEAWVEPESEIASYELCFQPWNDSSLSTNGILKLSLGLAPSSASIQ